MLLRRHGSGLTRPLHRQLDTRVLPLRLRRPPPSYQPANPPPAMAAEQPADTGYPRDAADPRKVSETICTVLLRCIGALFHRGSTLKDLRPLAAHRAGSRPEQAADPRGHPGKRHCERQVASANRGTGALEVLGGGDSKGDTNGEKAPAPICVHTSCSRKLIVSGRLQAHLPEDALKGPGLDVLEIAAGTGEHAAHLVAGLPVRSWLPTDYAGCAGPTMQPQTLDGDIFDSIVAHTSHLPCVKPPVALDAAEPEWTAVGEPGPVFDALVAINVTHISPPTVTEGLVAAAGRLLRPG